MIKPLPGYVLIEPIEDETEIDGVYLPDSSKDKPMKGKILAIGPMDLDRSKEFLKNPEVGVSVAIPDEGSIVFYKKWTNQEVSHEGKKYLLVHFNELLAVLE